MTARPLSRAVFLYRSAAHCRCVRPSASTSDDNSVALLPRLRSRESCASVKMNRAPQPVRTRAGWCHGTATSISTRQTNSDQFTRSRHSGSSSTHGAAHIPDRISTLVIVLAALVGGMLRHALHSVMDHNRADTVIAAALLLGTAAAAYGYNHYELIPAGIELKLSALDPDQTMIAGVSIQPVLRNENNFDVWWRLDSRESSVKTPKSSSSGEVGSGRSYGQGAREISGEHSWRSDHVRRTALYDAARRRVDCLSPLLWALERGSCKGSPRHSYL